MDWPLILLILVLWLSGCALGWTLRGMRDRARADRAALRRISQWAG